MIDLEKWSVAKVITIELKDAVENLQDTPTALPTEEPTESQISITLAKADLPVVKLNGSPNIPTVKYIMLLYAGGKNEDTASQTVYLRMLKNGSSLSSGSFSVGAGYYWTLNCWFFDVKVGDTLELRLWSSSSNVNWDYHAYACQPTRCFPYPSGVSKVIWVKTKNIVKHPELSLGNPHNLATMDYYLANGKTSHFIRFGTTTEAEHIELWKDYIFLAGYGDRYYKNSELADGSSTYRPYYRRNYIPTKIIVRELR